MFRSLENELFKWKSRATRYPLVLRGARQVGKTYLIEQFGKAHFSSFVSVNFEAQSEVIACFESLSPDEIITRLQKILKVNIIPGETLLFLDEIQSCPKALQALRYFKEKMPKLHLIAAGSLLEFTLIEGKFSFPVGRVQFLYLHPLSLDEYLHARGQALPNFNLNRPPPMDVHTHLNRLVKEYLLVGGMPAAVSSFISTLSLDEISMIHEILLSTYKADFSKYATPAGQRYLKILFGGVFPNIAKQFKYSKIDPDIRSRDLKEALNHLEWAGLFKPVQCTSASGIPLPVQVKNKRFKLLFLDVGLAQHALKIHPEDVYENEIIQINRGAIAEQFVGQELIAYERPDQLGSLFYWEKEKVGSSAEVDYVISWKNRIIPIEVKAGPTGRLKSLHQFIDEKKAPMGIYISESPLSFKDGLLSLPFYLISRLPQILEEILL
ncbi:MAG: ATP-binding protein [Chlamydiales bacterium]|nr:ATP-binding protein [Chlamydiales bacterium]